MKQQYNETVKQHPDCHLLFREGAFYEHSGEDVRLKKNIGE
jgi:DNA mismatch repair ATPase MutS